MAPPLSLVALRMRRHLVPDGGSLARRLCAAAERLAMDPVLPYSDLVAARWGRAPMCGVGGGCYGRCRTAQGGDCGRHGGSDSGYFGRRRICLLWAMQPGDGGAGDVLRATVLVEWWLVLPSSPPHRRYWSGAALVVGLGGGC